MRAKVPSSYLLATVALSICAFPRIVTAQISSDGSLSTTVSTDDAVNFLIENGDISGSNLFHSFLEFSIPNLGSAYFNNATDITNIFSRVTGGNISDIQGLIRANGTANLFLINPAGIVFGENASLDVGGSFFATTAESVVFGDDIEFSATQPEEAPLLTINITPGLQMGANSGDITVNGTGHNLTGSAIIPITNQDPSIPGLQVPSGQTLGLVGSNLTLDGGILTVPSGRVELSAVGNQNPSSQVGLEISNGQWQLTENTVESTGNILFSQQALVDASGTGQGTVQIRGGNLTMEDGSIVWLENRGSQAAGSIDLNITDNISLTRAAPNTRLASGIYADVSATATGKGSDITVNGGEITFQEGGHIQSRTFGFGNSGQVTVDALSIELIDTQTDRIIANLGTIIVQGSGNSGDVTINTQRIRIDGVGGISAANFFGSGDNGNVVINASESIEIQRSSSNGDNEAIIGASTISATGNAGNITINTPRLSLEGGALISSSTFGAGDSGTITINATEVITLSGREFDVGTATVESTSIRTAGVLLSESFRSATGLPNQVTGSGGDIIINTPRLEITDGAEIAVRHDDMGNAGELEINADLIFLDTQGQITANTVSGEGGNIDLTISDGLLLRNGSTIITEAGGIGNGGNININSDLVTLLEASQINANAFEGNGGNITITTQGLFRTPDSSITASSELGIDGVITLNTPEADNSAALIQLPTTFTDPSQQIAQGCAWTTTSSFYVTGRGGMPEDPTAIISVQDILSDVRTSPNTSSSVVTQNSSEVQSTIIEANTWIINEKGNVELVAIVTPQDPRYESLQASCAGK